MYNSVCFIFFVCVLLLSQSSFVFADSWEYLRSTQDEHFGAETLSRAPYSDEDVLKVFKVQNTRLYEDDTWYYDENKNLKEVDFRRATKKDLEKDEYKLWNIFAGIAGPDFVKKHVQGFVTFRDEHDSTLGSVWSYRKAVKSDVPWVLSVNANAADFSDAQWLKDMTIVMLHEYAHILTLNRTQQKYSSKKNLVCPAVRHSEKTVLGCSYPRAYITGYGKAFWSEDDRAHAQQVAQAGSDKKKRKLVAAYYALHTDDFVTQYAASSLEEDIAESYVDFILLRKPTQASTKKDKKVLYFYNFPELVAARDSIRERIEPTFQP